MIALVSDHGEEFYEHGGWWHGLTLYDEQIRVPHHGEVGPQERRAVAPADAARHTWWACIDVAPTLIARAGATHAWRDMQGDRPRRAAGGTHAREPNRLAVFSEEDHEGNVLRAVRTARRGSYIEANEGNPRGLPELELFHVVRDPGETSNVIDREPARVSELERHVEAQIVLAKQMAAAAGEAPAKLSAAEEEALRKLGYIE